LKKAGGLFLLFVFLSSAALTASDLSLILLDTPLPPAPVSPLSNLDLIPLPPSGIQDHSFQIISYTATAVSSGQKYIVPGIMLSNPGDSLYKISLVSLVALNAADYFSTLEALKYPGVKEGNAIMKPVVRDPYAFAAVKIGFTALTYYSLKSLYKKNKALAWTISIVSNIAYSYVVSNNLRIIHRFKSK
jgi:hypothetical protein